MTIPDIALRPALGTRRLHINRREDGMPQANVIKLSSTKNECDVDRFDEAYHGYCMWWTAYQKPNLGDDGADAAMEAWEDATWKLIQTPAVLPYQIARKLAVINNLLENADPVWRDRRERALIESVRLDVEAM